MKETQDAVIHSPTLPDKAAKADVSSSPTFNPVTEMLQTLQTDFNYSKPYAANQVSLFLNGIRDSRVSDTTKIVCMHIGGLL